MSQPLAFTPIKVGNITLSHRIAMAPMTRLRADGQHVHQDPSVEFYTQRASYPGTLLIGEGTIISADSGGMPNVSSIYTPEQVAGWKRIVDAVHAQGSFIFLQIAAVGRAANADVLKMADPSFEVVAPSAVAFEGGAVPRALTRDEIARIVQLFATAAKAFVEEAGGDGVEIHGASGYLVDEFTQTNSNKRTDEYGGSVENRARFALDVTGAVVAAVGAERVGLKLTPFSSYQGMKMPPADLEETFSYLVKELKSRHPNFGYLHLVDARADEVNEGESLDFLTNAWAPRTLFFAGGLNAEDAEPTVSKYENSVAVYGRHFTSNPDLVARIKHGVPFRAYDRSTFYVFGPENTEGYTTFPVEYGPEGKLV